MRALILNGPNLARLGTRQPEIYGSLTWSQVCDRIADHARAAGVDADIRQTDSEAELIGWLHEAADEGIPVVINPAAFTHYSYGVRDAAAELGAPLIEVHLSNPAAREEFRHVSVISGIATGTITGFGVDSYLLAIDALVAISRP